MSRRLWKHRITDIIDSIKKIQMYVEHMEIEDFRSDEKTIDAVIRNFIVIGEAARHVPDYISLKYPNIPWRVMGDMRNFTVHEYWGVECAILPSMSTGELNFARSGKPSMTTFRRLYPV